MTIRIESILGGQGQTTEFQGSGQFRASLGIDPAQPFDDSDTVFSTVASGLLRPTPSQKISGTTVTAPILWFLRNPKNMTIYAYGSNGSIYTIDPTLTNVTALAGLDVADSQGNGAEYYDNYLYFARNQDVARYGPLNGTPTLTTNYWTGTLAKGALNSTSTNSYPTSRNLIPLPNHVLKRHSNGKLYIADLVGNNATLHYIQTSKTSVEGDTGTNSTANALTLGYGLWPTAIESIGQELAIACYEGGEVAAVTTLPSVIAQQRAKIAFWDTTSTNFNTIVWCEFPDSIITALKNRNGTLYAVSGNVGSRGFRVSRYAGAYTFQEVYYSETGEPCLPGAIDAILDRVLIGTHTTVPESAGCVYGLGLQKSSLSTGTFNVMRATAASASTTVTAIVVPNDSTSSEMGFNTPMIAWTDQNEPLTAAGTHGIDVQKTEYNNAPSVWWSSVYRIGQPFRIKRIRIPLAQTLTSNMTIVPTLYYDNGIGSQTLTTINSTNFSGRVANIYINNNETNQGMGFNNFWLELKWTGSALLTVGLPILIDYEVIPD